MRGKLIVFEGCEGTGKSTQIRLLADYLKKSGEQVVTTREPGGCTIAEQIRGMVLDAKNSGLSDECEALLFAAAREQHLHDTVLPALGQGKTVLCDRYYYSSLAYQGHARPLGMDYVRRINAGAIEKAPPDITVFLDLPPEAGFARKHGAEKDDRMESQGLAFHKKVYEGYKLAFAGDGRVVAIDAQGSAAHTHGAIVAELKKRGIVK